MPCKDGRQKLLLENSSCAKNILLGCFWGGLDGWTWVSVLVCRKGALEITKKLIEILKCLDTILCLLMPKYKHITQPFGYLPFNCIYIYVYIHVSPCTNTPQIYVYITSISGDTANDLTWCNVKCAFSRCVFYFIPQFGLHLCKLGHEEIVMNYQATLNYHQTSF